MMRKMMRKKIEIKFELRDESVIDNLIAAIINSLNIRTNVNEIDRYQIHYEGMVVFKNPLNGIDWID